MERRPVAYILENDVRHARLLPVASAHAFNYKTLSLLLPLRALEEHQLDLGDGWLFCYDNAAPMSLTGIRPSAYFSSLSKKGSIRTKLEAALERFGHEPGALRDAWMQTMPRYMFVEGINPLTVYYCYKHGSDRLWAVVLEVHNTFEEQHAYVLAVGDANEERHVHQGFDHSWTFPRQFHVSPFNDRSGYYTCSIVEPPNPPDTAPINEASSSPPSVRIELRTTDTRELKLVASLRPTRLTAFNSRSMILALARQPFTLFLSFTRIVIHAAILHYGRKLDVYARPEPLAVSPSLEALLPIDRNAVQRLSGELGVGGGTGWQSEGLLEQYARRKVENWIAHRAQETGLFVTLESSNPEYGTKCFGQDPERDSSSRKCLRITFRSPRFFTILFTCPSAAHALLLGSATERLFSTSDENLFIEVFSSPSSPDNASHFSHRLHPRYATQLVRLRAIPPNLRVLSTHSTDFSGSVLSVHPLDTQQSFFSALVTYSVVYWLLLVPRLEYAIFTLLRARFVRGTEPWAGWKRAEEVVRENAAGINGESITKTNKGEADTSMAWIGSVRMS